MEYSGLNDLICALEHGTKLHISIVFRNNHGNEKTALPKQQCIHTCPVCDAAKMTPDGFAGCFRCRNTVLKLCIRHKRSFGGFCTKGVYEYCHPVIRGDDVLAVIFIGNILTDSTQQRNILKKQFDDTLIATMQTDYPEQACVRTADILESYILLLLEKYGNTAGISNDTLVRNIKNYINENLLFDFSMSDLSVVFNYNEKYLGRLFKHKAGCTIKEYCNASKIELSKILLENKELSISDISARSGFNNVTYFNRIFKRITGLSPQEYRNTKEK